VIDRLTDDEEEKKAAAKWLKYVLGNPARAHHQGKSRDATADGASTNF
jgi:hypothetical protein